MEPLTRSLIQLGLSHHEARIYGALLGHSPAGASWVAKKCGLSRSSVYTALQTLADKGLVGTTYHNEVKQFIAEGHAALMDYVKKEQLRANERVRSAEELSDQFQLISSGPVHVPQIVYFEGQQGLKRIYMSMLRDIRAGSMMWILRDEFLFQEGWKFVFQRDWHERVRRMKRDKDVTTRLLVNRSSLERKNAALYRSRMKLEHRFLPKDNPVQGFALYLADDIVSILSMENNNLVGIKIVNRHLAANFGAMFSTLWVASRP